MLAFALVRQRVETGQNFIDKTRMAHQDAMLRQPVKKLPYQAAEIGRPGEIIGAGKSRIEGDPGPRGAAAELRAQYVKEERLWRDQPPRQRSGLARLPDPGGGRHVLHRRKEGITDLRIELHMLVAIDEIRGAAEQSGKGRKLHLHFRGEDFRIKPPRKAG